MSGSGCVTMRREFTQKVPPASSLPDHAPRSASAGKPKSFACAGQREGRHQLSGVLSRMKSYVDSLRAEFTAQPSLHVISALSPFFVGLGGT